MLIMLGTAAGYAESCIEFANQNWIINYPLDSPSEPDWRNGEMGGPGGAERGYRGGGGPPLDPCQGRGVGGDVQ